MVRPSGIPVTFYLLTTAITIRIIAVHIGVLVGVYGFGTAVLTVTAGRTLAV